MYAKSSHPATVGLQTARELQSKVEVLITLVKKKMVSRLSRLLPLPCCTELKDRYYEAIKQTLDIIFSVKGFLPKMELGI